jgi:hypothetical protein
MPPTPAAGPGLTPAISSRVTKAQDMADGAPGRLVPARHGDHGNRDPGIPGCHSK